MMQNNKFLILLGVFCLVIITESCVTLRAGATSTLVVDSNGQADFSSIQEAVDAAANGDSIEVMPGTYYEHVVVNKSVSLVGHEDTFIDGTGNGTVVNIEADSVYLGGFTVQNSGSGGGGILLSNSRGCAIQGNTVMSNACGVQLINSEDNVIRDNLVHGNDWGVRLLGSKNNTVEQNSVSSSSRIGLYLESSDSNIITWNSLTGNAEGIYFESSSNNHLRNNNLTDSIYSFGVFGSQLSHYVQDVDVSNTIDNKPVCYWVNEHDRQVPTGIGYIAIVNSTGIVLKNLNLTGQQEGPLIAFSTDSIVENMYVSGAKYGLRLFSCSNINVKNNTFDRNSKNLRLDISFNNTISRNMILGGHEGAYLDNSSMNLISENLFVKNINGMFVYYSSNNMIYHNNFIDSENSHVFLAASKTLLINSWDDGAEGNYWSNFTVTDLNEDGLGDDPYTLSLTNSDRYPLMGNYSVFDVLIEQQQSRVRIVCNSSISDFDFQSDYGLISFNVTGDDGTGGFCRLTVPSGLLNGSYEVLVDGLPPLSLRELNSSQPDELVLYFTYYHSTHKVVIVPEYRLLLILLCISVLFAVAYSLRIRKGWIASTAIAENVVNRV
jgi:parallel beta-helix repeat protein